MTRLDPITTFMGDHADEARRLTEPLIWAARGDPAEMKRRVMLALEHGSLTAEEAESWIVLQGLESD